MRAHNFMSRHDCFDSFLIETHRRYRIESYLTILRYSELLSLCPNMVCKAILSRRLISLGSYYRYIFYTPLCFFSMVIRQASQVFLWQLSILCVAHINGIKIHYKKR